MPDIHHDLPIRAPRGEVFTAISTPLGLDTWWTMRARGAASEGHEYELWFGPAYDWRARVVRAVPGLEFELCMTRADADWTGTRIGFRLADQQDGTQLSFHHVGWPQANAHYRTSSYCWAMYLRVLRLHLERGISIPYEERLDA